MASICASPELRSWAPAALLSLAAAFGVGELGCAEESPVSCEMDRCAAGQVCDLSDGLCKSARSAPWEDVGRHLSAVALADGRVFLAAASTRPSALVGGWLLPGETQPQLEAVVEGVRVEAGTAVAIGRDGHPRVAFHDAGLNALRLARFNGTNWEIETVIQGSQGRAVGGLPALALGPEDQELIAFRHGAAGGVMVASRTGRSWQTRAVDIPAEGPGAAGGRGLALSLVLASDRPFIAHYDADAKQLRTVVQAEPEWRSAVFGGEQAVGRGGERGWGRFVDAALDPLGNAGIAFTDDVAGTLLVAWNERGELRVETADSGAHAPAGAHRAPHLVGSFASLAFDRDGRPRVAYQDGAEGSLRWAVRSPEGWSSVRLAAGPLAAMGVALVALPEGRFVVLHRRLTIGAAGRPSGQIEVVRPEALQP